MFPSIEIQLFCRSHSVLRFTIQKSLFIHKSGDKRVLKIRCAAKIYDIYHRGVDATIQFEKKRKTSFYLPVTSTEATVMEENTEETQILVDDYHSNWIEDFTDKCNQSINKTVAFIIRFIFCSV